MRSCILFLLYFILLSGLLPAQPVAGKLTEEPIVLEAPEWSALFDRTSGWTGSDAVYSIPFSGSEKYDTPADDSTMFLFGDTFIGEVDQNNARQGSVLIRNTIGILNTRTPLPEEITFYWKTNEQDQPEELFSADTPESDPGDWIWPMDGIRIGERFYIYGLRLFDPPGFANFEINGVTLISFELNSLNEITNYEHLDTPLFFKDDDGTEIVIGQAVLPMTTGSGNPDPDGYIYVFGPRNRPLNFKQMVVSRVLPENIEDFSSYEFWDGSSWQSDIQNCAVLTDSISQEFSVTPLSDGRCIVVFEFDGWVCVRSGDTLTGPFDPVQYIYNCPEDTTITGGFVYNAKAHPHLSEDEQLLISYNVNTSDYNELYQNADSYRPRFIRYFLPETGSSIRDGMGSSGVENFQLEQNYPNPFNGSTLIPFRADRPGRVHIGLYNIRGEKVTTIIDRPVSAGRHQVTFPGDGHTLQQISSGVYFYVLEAGTQKMIRKLIYVK